MSIETAEIEDVQIKSFDLKAEDWREYDFDGRVYRIDEPHTLFMREGGTTHRVLDSRGVVHCLPVPGVNGCVLRWKNLAGHEPVQF